MAGSDERENRAEARATGEATAAGTALEETLPPLPSASRRRIGLGVAIAAAVIAVGLGAWAAIAALQTSPLERAADACGGTKPLSVSEVDYGDVEGAEGGPTLDELFEGAVTIADDGKTLTLQTSSLEVDRRGVTALVLDCVYEELDVPERVTESIADTRAVDGRQSDGWGDFAIEWNFGHDTGTNVVITQR